MGPQGRSLAIFPILILTLPLIAGCVPNRMAFTHVLRQQYHLSDEELKNLQYYVSHDIVLQHEVRKEDREISKSHKLVTREGGVYEEILIRSNTPGIATQVGANTLSISFEPGAALLFGSPEKDPDGQRIYKLLAKRWTGGYGELEYGDKTYYAVWERIPVYLMIDAETLSNVERKQKVLPGIVLPGGGEGR